MGLLLDEAAEEDPGAEDMEGETVEGEEAVAMEVQARYWRERKAAALRAKVDHDVAECERQLALLQAQAKAARPWASRVQAATQLHDKAAEALAAALADLEAAKLVVQVLQAAAEAARTAEQSAAQELAAVRAEAAAQPERAKASDPPMLGGTSMEELVEAVVRTAAAAGMDVAVLTGRVAEAEVRRKQALVAALQTPVASQPQLGHGHTSQPSNPAAQPDPPTATGRQQGRRSRSRGAGKDDDALSEAGSAALGGRPRHR